MKKSSGGSSGSPRHTESIGPGPVAGAGEYQPKSSTKMGRPGANAISGSEMPKASGASGKGKVPNHTRGREEDGN